MDKKNVHIKTRVQQKQWILLLLPAILYLCFIYIYPICKVLLLSLYTPNFTIDNFSRIASTSVYMQVIWITFKISFVVTVICMVAGYILAYLLAHLSNKAVNILMIFVLVPFWTSMLVRTYAWMVLLGRRGVVNEFMIGIGALSEPLSMMHNSFGNYIGMVHILLPYMVLPIYSVMKGIDPNLVTAAQNLGANRLQSFLRIYLPLSLPGVGAGFILVFILSIGFYITPSLLGGPREMMISLLIERQINELLNWGFGSALAVTLLILTGVLFLLFKFTTQWLKVESAQGTLG